MTDREAALRIVEAAKEQFNQQLAEKEAELGRLHADTGRGRLDEISQLRDQIAQIQEDLPLADQLVPERPPVAAHPQPRQSSYTKCL